MTPTTHRAPHRHRRTAAGRAGGAGEVDTTSFDRFVGTHPPRTVVVGGVEWRYVRCGRPDREALLLLPGGTGQHEAEFAAIEALEQDLDVVCVTYRPAASRDAAGGQPWPGAPWSP